MLAAVLRAEPEWSAVPSDTPRAVRRLLRRCLQKDRRRRLQHIGDARLELADADDSESPAPVVSVAAQRQLWPIVVAAVAGAAVVAFAAWMMKPAPLERPVTRFTIQVPELMARVFGSGASVAISPDGAHACVRRRWHATRTRSDVGCATAPWNASAAPRRITAILLARWPMAWVFCRQQTEEGASCGRRGRHACRCFTKRPWHMG